VIGSHSQALHIGEIVAPLQRNKPIVCQSCGEKPCPIWGGAIQETQLHSFYRSFSRYKSQGRVRRYLSRLAKNNRKSTIYESIFAHFPEKNIIIDNSKNIFWARYHDMFYSYDVKYVFLYRDLRAIWASHLRKQKIPSKDFFKKVKRNINNMQNLYRSLNRKQKYALQYETLVTHPEQEIAKLCEFLGVDFLTDMLRFYEYTHHTLGANRNTILQSKEAQINNKQYLDNEIEEEDRKYYVESNSGFKLDERWRSELSEESLSLLEKHLGQTSVSIGYDMKS